MRAMTIEIITEDMTDDQIAAVVRIEAPWASRWATVEGGVRAWESIADYETWIRQV